MLPKLSISRRRTTQTDDQSSNVILSHVEQYTFQSILARRIWTMSEWSEKCGSLEPPLGVYRTFDLWTRFYNYLDNNWLQSTLVLTSILRHCRQCCWFSFDEIKRKFWLLNQSSLSYLDLNLKLYFSYGSGAFFFPTFIIQHNLWSVHLLLKGMSFPTHLWMVPRGSSLKLFATVWVHPFRSVHCLKMVETTLKTSGEGQKM